MSDDIPMTDFSALEREGRSDVERSALRRAGEFYHVIIDMQAAELTSLRQRVADMTRVLRSAHHALTLLNGCVATDRPDQVPGMDTDKYKNLVWEVDTDNELAEIDAALASSDSK